MDRSFCLCDKLGKLSKVTWFKIWAAQYILSKYHLPGVEAACLEHTRHFAFQSKPFAKEGLSPATYSDESSPVLKEQNNTS